jgi:hypothetical protein
MTKTAPQTEQPETTLAPRQEGVDLLDQYLGRLPALNYRKLAIDTWRNDYHGHSVRHSYVGDEWTLTAWYDGQPATQVKWSRRAAMPGVDQLVSDTIPGAF